VSEKEQTVSVGLILDKKASGVERKVVIFAKVFIVPCL
jgi:hypothetical protein